MNLNELCESVVKYVAMDVRGTYFEEIENVYGEKKEELIINLSIYASRKYLEEIFIFYNGELPEIKYEEVKDKYDYYIRDCDEHFKLFMKKTIKPVIMREAIEYYVTSYVEDNILEEYYYGGLQEITKNEAINDSYDNQILMSPKEIEEFDALFDSTRF